MTAHVRDVLDRYFTPDALARACVGALDLAAPSTVVEPSVGGGAFARAVRARWPEAAILGVDVDPAATGFEDCDGVVVGPWVSAPAEFAPYDLVVGNPPYRDAEAHVRAALATAPVVGMLLRLGFLASQARREFWMAHPPAVVHVLPRRPSFIMGGRTDGSEYAFYVWDDRTDPGTGLARGTIGTEPVLRWLDWTPDAPADAEGVTP